MKLAIILTASQAIAIQALPFLEAKRDSCGATVTVTNTVTDTVTYTESLATRIYTGVIEIIESQFPAVILKTSTKVTESTSTEVLTSQTTAAAAVTSTSINQATLTSTSFGTGAIFKESTITTQAVTTTAVTASVSVLTTTASSGVVQILPSTSVGTTGTVQTSISALVSSNPVISTVISSPTSILSNTGSVTTVASLSTSIMASANIFQPVATGAPPSVIGSRSDHPVARLGIVAQKSPLSTNKFYANFFLGTQTAPAFTHPYALSWSKGAGVAASWGLAVSHVDSNQKVFGADNSIGAASYFINPNGITSIIISALELGSNTTLASSALTAFSMNLSLLPSAGASPAITFPLVQGMGFVTGIFTGATPVINTGVFFRTVTANASPKPGVTKYTILLEDGKTWYLYATSLDNKSITFTVVSNSVLQATSNFNGYIQIAKNGGTGSAALYDAACGVYASTTTLSGTASGAAGSYTLSFNRSGISNGSLAMFALPHHLESLESGPTITTVTLNTTTKGVATAIVADSWTLSESSMPVSMDFAPWSPSLGSQSTLSSTAIEAIASVAASEVSQNMNTQTDLDSFYYSGKVMVSRRIF